MKKYFFYIFGCQMNYADSERVASILQDLGWQMAGSLAEADAVFLFTCSVRQKAEDRVIGFLRNLKKWKAKKSQRRIGLTGCMVRQSSAQIDPKKDALLHKIEELDFVWRIEESAQLSQFLPLAESSRRGALAGEALLDYFKIIPTAQKKISALVPIMTGCDNFCSYCIVPFARGRERSRSMKEIIEECKNAVKNGALEITLLGQNVNSYQKKPGAFASLLSKIAKTPNLKRLRFMSSHPKDFDESVIEVMHKFPNIERHLHLPIQHGDSSILKKMNRGYTSAHYLKLIKKFRAKLPEASITTDFIVGFPGETDRHFENLLKFYRIADFDFAYFAKYSPRIGTPAAEFLNQVLRQKKSERWRRLNQLMVETSKNKLKGRVGEVLGVLVEGCSEKICYGRSSEFFLVKFRAGEDSVGKLVEVKIVEAREVELMGIMNNKL